MAARSEELLKLAEKLQTHSFSQDLLDSVYMDFCGTVKDEMQQKVPKYEHKKHCKHKPWWNPELKQVRIRNYP